MALVDPYAPCHCGSGQKYKWCCQSVEAYVERSQRLLDNGQYELALNPLIEGLLDPKIQHGTPNVNVTGYATIGAQPGCW